MVKEKRADLHVHTTYSDGSFSPEEVVEHAKRVGLDCIAITDHDSVNGIEEAKQTGDALGVEIVPAVEVSADEDGKEIHILGYYINYKDSKLLDILKQIREDRKKRLYKMVEALNQHGLSIDAEDLIKFCGDVSISRLHIAHYMKEKKLVSSWREAFHKYIGDTKPCYVSSFRFSPKQTIDLIKEAKGIPVIAHPGLNRLEGFVDKMVEEGIEGIEVFHGEHSGCMVQHYQKYAKEHNLLLTGGSDCHGKAKGEILMGRVTIPYSYVEALKKHRQ